MSQCLILFSFISNKFTSISCVYFYVRYLNHLQSITNKLSALTQEVSYSSSLFLTATHPDAQLDLHSSPTWEKATLMNRCLVKYPRLTFTCVTTKTEILFDFFRMGYLYLLQLLAIFSRAKSQSKRVVLAQLQFEILFNTE